MKLGSFIARMLDLSKFEVASAYLLFGLLGMVAGFIGYEVVTNSEAFVAHTVGMSILAGVFMSVLIIGGIGFLFGGVATICYEIQKSSEQ